MTHQASVAVRNGRADAVETVIGVSAVLKIRTGAPPANVATADSGTVLATLNLPSDWMNAASAGAKTKLGTWQDASADAAGTPGHFRIYASDGTTPHWQGTAGPSVVIATSAATSANGNVLTFTATTGVVVGMNVSGTGIPTGATVVAVTGTTVTLSHTSTAGVSSAASITFSYDLPTDGSTINVGQVVTVNSFTITEAMA
jgi:hypothetical protein